ncbi:hypothetical protein Hokovirus_2_33 [Hokovirus HKV1]|uniref:Uncharacterized protein n=1 Tax=Hokovirus HKV1 TaxID=1977638 RepID=A0A1V0SFK3_9VIRU|nr:hypothetical protein Hokovirus_2_33 [Hokovirus HKV1]
MELKILELDAHINIFGELKMANYLDGSTIEKEQLLNYDFILIHCSSNYYTTMKLILENQNYVYSHFYMCPNKHIDTYCYVNRGSKINIYIYSPYVNTYFDLFNRIYLSYDNIDDFFQDKLSCFILDKFPEKKNLDNAYKITKINVPNVYYLERKGQLTKAAVK